MAFLLQAISGAPGEWEGRFDSLRDNDGPGKSGGQRLLRRNEKRVT